MTYLLIFYVIALAVWFIGILIAFYHCNKYKLPGDKTMLAFWSFFVFAGAAFFWSVTFVSSVNWSL